MADTEKDKAWVNILVEKEMIEDFDEVVKEMDTDRSKLIRSLMRDAIKTHKHALRLKKSVQGNAIVRRNQL